jgi:acyl-homoserine lactone synthase
MILLLNAANKAAFPALLDDMFRARHEVFVDLKKWEELRRPDGRDIDAWDRDDSVYLVSAKGDRVMGAVRFTGASGTSLAETIHPELFEETPPRGDDFWEMSRLFARPEAVTKDGQSPVVSELLVACAELARIVGSRGSLMITELKLVQAMLSWGANPEPLGLPQRTRDGTVIAVMSHASAFAARNLRKARGIERPIIAWAEAPDREPKLYADLLGIDPFDSAWTPPEGFTVVERAHMTPRELAARFWPARTA